MNDIPFSEIEKKATSFNIKKIAEKEEVTKNQQAFSYMAIVASVIFFIFFMLKLPAAKLEAQVKEDTYVEVEIEDPINLGNDANGALGDIQPLIKGDFAPPDATPETTPAPPTNEPVYEPTPTPVTNDRDNDAVEVPKPKKNPPVRINNPTPRTISTPKPTNPTPAPPKPRASMGTPRPGGTGNGNGANVDNGISRQGNGNGTGDQGNPFGTPNGKGQRLSNVNLKNSGEIERLTNQSGTNYKGKVTLKLRVDENGSVTSILSNSPSPFNKEAKAFAQTTAYKMKFPTGADGRTATIVLDFDY